MEQEKKQNDDVLNLYDFMCLFLLVIRENDDIFFYIEPLKELILRCKEEGLYEDILRGINVTCDYSLTFKNTLDRLNGLLISSKQKPKGLPDYFDINLFYDRVISKYTRYIDSMFNFVDEYYELLNENEEYLLDNDIVNDNFKVKIL